MPVAAVSRDTVRSSLGSAATPVTVSVTATLLLAVPGSPGQLRWGPRPAKWPAVLEAT